jgi:hypothetical protein
MKAGSVSPKPRLFISPGLFNCVKKTARIAERSGSRRWALFFIALDFDENIQFPHQVL